MSKHTDKDFEALKESYKAMGKERDRLKEEKAELLAALRRASLALAFAAETSDAMKDDYEAVRAAIAKVATPD